MYQHSLLQFRAAIDLLRNVDQYRVSSQPTPFEAVTRALSSRADVFSVRDLLEGVAVVESFELTTASPDLEGFLGFRETNLPVTARHHTDVPSTTLQIR